MAEPTLLLLDEPAAGVNPRLLEVIVERIVEINRRGVAFLVIEHNMDVIVRLCGRVFVMAAGKLLCEGRPSEVVRDPARHRRLSRRARHERADAAPLVRRTWSPATSPACRSSTAPRSHVAAGEIVAVLGPNGAGKSTLHQGDRRPRRRSAAAA